MLEISNAEMFYRWNPEVDGSAVITQKIILDNMPSVKVIPKYVSLVFTGNSKISFRKGLSLSPFFIMNGGSLLNVKIDMKGITFTEGMALIDGNYNGKWSSGLVKNLSIKNVSLDNCKSVSVILNSNVHGSELYFENIQIGSEKNPVLFNNCDKTSVIIAKIPKNNNLSFKNISCYVSSTGSGENAALIYECKSRNVFLENTCVFVKKNESVFGGIGWSYAGKLLKCCCKFSNLENGRIIVVGHYSETDEIYMENCVLYGKYLFEKLEPAFQGGRYGIKDCASNCKTLYPEEISFLVKNDYSFSQIYLDGVKKECVPFDRENDIFRFISNKIIPREMTFFPWINEEKFSLPKLIIENYCIFHDMNILTENGNVKIQDLKKDDVLKCTNSKGELHLSKILAIFVYEVSAKRKRYAPYLIPKNTFSNNIPSENTYLSSHHAIKLEDEKWCHPYHKFKRVYFADKFIWYQIQTENYLNDIIHVNEMPVESFTPFWSCYTWECESDACYLKRSK